MAVAGCSSSPVGAAEPRLLRCRSAPGSPGPTRRPLGVHRRGRRGASGQRVDQAAGDDVAGHAVVAELDVQHPLGDDAPRAPPGDAPILQGMLDGEEHAGRRAGVALVDEDGAALQQIASDAGRACRLALPTAGPRKVSERHSSASEATPLYPAATRCRVARTCGRPIVTCARVWVTSEICWGVNDGARGGAEDGDRMSDWTQDPPRADVVGKEIARLAGAREKAEREIEKLEKAIENAKNEIRLIDRMLAVLRGMETTPEPPPPPKRRFHLEE